MGKDLFSNHRATFIRLIKTDTSSRCPMTDAKVCPELIPKTATAPAIASTKLLDAAVKLRVVDHS